MTPGDFVELGSGLVKGKHRGLGAYTIGQRARIGGESEKYLAEFKFIFDLMNLIDGIYAVKWWTRIKFLLFQEGNYILSTNPKKRIVPIDGFLQIYRNHPALFKKSITVSKIVWISGSPPPHLKHQKVPLLVKYRSRSDAVPALVTLRNGSEVLVDFENPQDGLTPGQTVAFYTSEGECLGSGDLLLAT
jgi:tRNA-5-taurinomethyluridine 2-sulfurtransferase